MSNTGMRHCLTWPLPSPSLENRYFLHICIFLQCLKFSSELKSCRAAEARSALPNLRCQAGFAAWNNSCPDGKWSPICRHTVRPMTSPFPGSVYWSTFARCFTVLQTLWQVGDKHRGFEVCPQRPSAEFLVVQVSDCRCQNSDSHLQKLDPCELQSIVEQTFVLWF